MALFWKQPKNDDVERLKVYLERIARERLEKAAAPVLTENDRKFLISIKIEPY